MRCPKCGNEVGPEEAFCGQCGTPMRPPAQPTEVVQTTPSYNGLPGGYTRHVPPSSNSYNIGIQPSPNGYNSAMLAPPGSSLPPNQSTTRPLGPQQQTNFYQDATEAMTSLPGQPGQAGHPIQNYPPQNPQQSFAGTPVQGGYPGPGQFGPQQQPFQQGGYVPAGYTPSQPFPTGQGYGIPPQKQQNHTLLIVACIFLAIALLSVTGFGVLYLTRDHSSPGTSTTVAPTATTAATATPLPSPTPSPSLSPSPNASPSPTASSAPTNTPVPSPSPTTIATPTPDANFSWCQSCSSLGFSVEYPNGWTQGTTSDEPGVQFQNQTIPQEYAAFKTPNNVTPNTTATDLANADLQNNFEKQPEYVPPSSQSTATIGGENWVTETASYQSANGQEIQVEVFATIRQGKAYIIELQAPKDQFGSENDKYFQLMLSRFQFE